MSEKLNIFYLAKSHPTNQKNLFKASCEHSNIPGDLGL